MHRKRRHYMTLLEVIIAMSLTMVVLTTLTFFYQQISTYNITMDKIQQESFKKLYAQTRLMDTLPKTLNPDKKGEYFFFTLRNLDPMFLSGSDSLVFTFDNCVKLDSRFANHVLGRLYVDNDGRLTLAMWPSPARWEDGKSPPMMKEVLLEGVEKIKFSFYVVPYVKEKKQTKEEFEESSARSPQIRGDWVDDWLSDYDELPAMVKIEMTLKDTQELTYILPFANVKKHVVYRE